MGASMEAQRYNNLSSTLNGLPIDARTHETSLFSSMNRGLSGSMHHPGSVYNSGGGASGYARQLGMYARSQSPSTSRLSQSFSSSFYEGASRSLNQGQAYA